MNFFVLTFILQKFFFLHVYCLKTLEKHCIQIVNSTRSHQYSYILNKNLTSSYNETFDFSHVPKEK